MTSHAKGSWQIHNAPWGWEFLKTLDFGCFFFRGYFSVVLMSSLSYQPAFLQSRKSRARVCPTRMCADVFVFGGSCGGKVPELFLSEDMNGQWVAIPVNAAILHTSALEKSDSCQQGL